jgi:hypothetical protein
MSKRTNSQKQFAMEGYDAVNISRITIRENQQVQPFDKMWVANFASSLNS